MGAYPTSPRAAFLAWCQAHTSVFAGEATHIGLTAAQATAFTAAVNAAAKSNAEQESARLAYRAATQDNSDQFVDLRRSAAEMVRSIRTYAENTGNENVYVLAQIPPPADPSTAPPPAQPRELRVSLLPTNGALELRWAASNPAGTTGTSYIVRRRLPDESGFTFIGVTGEKRFVDNTFFSGPDSVEYTVQGQRADSAGPVSLALMVRFGRTGPGIAASITSQTVQGGSKLAA